MINDPSTPNPASVTSSLSMDKGIAPVNSLQRAREEHNWTRAEIAASLCLNVKVITALEDGDYSNLPIPTFVRGYIRNYANLLGLDPEPVLAAYERHGLNAPPPVALFTNKPSSSDHVWHFFSYIVVIGLIILVAVWWKSDIPPDMTPEQIAPNNMPPQELALPEIPSRELAEILSVGPPPEDTSPPQTHSPSAEQTAPANPSPTAPTVNPQTDPPTATPASPTPPPNMTNPTPVEGPPTVTIRVTTDTWAEIRDHKGKKLFKGKIKANQNQSVHGHAPFKVRLGKIEGVSVDYNGQTFDYTNYIKGKTANFVLGNKPNLEH